MKNLPKITRPILYLLTASFLVLAGIKYEGAASSRRATQYKAYVTRTDAEIVNYRIIVDAVRGDIERSAAAVDSLDLALDLQERQNRALRAGLSRAVNDFAEINESFSGPDSLLAADAGSFFADTIFVIPGPRFTVTRPILENYHSLKSRIEPALRLIVKRQGGVMDSDSVIIGDLRSVRLQLRSEILGYQQIDTVRLKEITAYNGLYLEADKMYRRERRARRVMQYGFPVLIVSALVVKSQI